AGADDYLGKPFSIAELTARVRALGRRGPRFAESTRTYGELRIDLERRTLTFSTTKGDERMPLTPREFDIVALLAYRDGRVVARDESLEAVWGEANTSSAASLEVLVTRIRRKLTPRACAEVIRTVRQVGARARSELASNARDQ